MPLSANLARRRQPSSVHPSPAQVFVGTGSHCLLRGHRERRAPVVRRIFLAKHMYACICVLRLCFKLRQVVGEYSAPLLGGARRHVSEKATTVLTCGILGRRRQRISTDIGNKKMHKVNPTGARPCLGYIPSVSPLHATTTTSAGGTFATAVIAIATGTILKADKGETSTPSSRLVSRGRNHLCQPRQRGR